LRLGKDVFRPGILKLEHAVRSFVRVRQQRLMLVVEQLYGALLDCACKHEGSVGLPHQRQVEAERVVCEEVLLRNGVGTLQKLVAVGKPAEALNHSDMSMENLVKHVQWVIRRELSHRPIPFFKAQILIVQRLGVREHQAEEDSFDRAQASTHADAQAALNQGAVVRVAVVHLRRVAYMLRGNWSSMMISATSKRGCSTSKAQWS
jgi:hypothetical protein